jgi:hypothetical protein
MLKKYYLLLVCFSFCISFSQNIIKGEVKDSNKQPIISASVILKNDTGKIPQLVRAEITPAGPSKTNIRG